MLKDFQNYLSITKNDTWKCVKSKKNITCGDAFLVNRTFEL